MAYSLLAGRYCERITGPDLYTVLLAKELVKHNYEVSIIAYAEEGPPIEYVAGVKVIKIRGRFSRSNLPLKALNVYAAMRKARADIYFQQGGAGSITPLFCRLNRKRSVISIASEGYVRKELKDWGSTFRLNSALEIRLADTLIVQTDFQKAMLKKHFGKESVMIKNPFPLTERITSEKAKPPVVLWVGSLDSVVKQPEWLLKLATLVPEAKFQIMGGSVGRYHYERIEQMSRDIGNLQLLGCVPFHETNRYFEEAVILVNTSKYEGFPNAFIQAWMCYTPVVSLNADPDEIICRYQLGLHSKTFDQLEEDVKTLLGNEQLREEMGRNGRSYVEREHDINKIVEQYREVFNRL
ncbi:glycosyltransferase family 4 protein [Chloroflexota bacterium]